MGAWIALAAALAYIVISLVIGDIFPFSRHSMYASTAMRDKGAVPLMLADDKPAELDDYHRFVGIDPDQLYPSQLPCSLEWQVHEASRWLRDKAAEPDSGPGPVKISWGFVILRVMDDGTIQERWRPVQEGSAWPR
jgi:hypothetical protein